MANRQNARNRNDEYAVMTKAEGARHRSGVKMDHWREEALERSRTGIL